MDTSGARRDRPFSDVLAEAAIAAEFDTGVREETVEQARSHIIVRIGRVTAGTFVTFAGVLMLALPGPGLVTVAAGLSILAVDVPFARRLLQQVQARMPTNARGGTPRWLVVVGSLGLLGGIAGSLAFALGIG